MAIIHRSSNGADQLELRHHLSFRRPLLTAARWIAAVIVFPILLGAVVFFFLVNSSRGHAYLINLIEKQAGEDKEPKFVNADRPAHCLTVSRRLRPIAPCHFGVDCITIMIGSGFRHVMAGDGLTMTFSATLACVAIELQQPMRLRFEAVALAVTSGKFAVSILGIR